MALRPSEENTMRSLPRVLALAAAAVLASCASLRAKVHPPPSDPVSVALAAQGGAKALARVKTFAAKGTARFWEPEQSVKPGGEPRLAADATFLLSRNLETDSARIEWTKSFVYPSPRKYTYTEYVTPFGGYVSGIDSTSRTKQSLDSSPPQHAMSGMRVVATLRELERTSPRLLLDMAARPASVVPRVDVPVPGGTLPAVSYDREGTTYFVLFDRGTHLPSRIRTFDADNVRGDSTYDLVLEDWRDVEGVRIPFRQRYELNGVPVVRIQYDGVELNPSLAGNTFDLPLALRGTAPPPATGPVPFQWVIRRQHIGVYLDSDAVSFDPQATRGLELVELAPGVSQVRGGTHNSLVVELADALVVFDAPVGEWQSRWTLDAAKAKYPGKPVKYLVLTHHHMDHVGGARTYVAEGAAVIVGAGSGEHFRRVLAAPDHIAGGALDRNPRKAEVEEVADRKVLGDGARTVEVLRVENPHADPMLIGWVPGAKLGFVSDLWSPGRAKLGDTLDPLQAALVEGVKKAGLSPERFAGGHGTVAEYAPLAALAAKGSP